MTKEFDKIVGFHVCDDANRDPKCPECGKEFIVPSSPEWIKKWGEYMMTTRACLCCKRERLLRCDVNVCHVCTLYPEYNIPNRDAVFKFALDGEDREKEWFYKFKFLQEYAEDKMKEDQYVELSKNLKKMPKEQKIEIYKTLNPVVKSKKLFDLIDENLPRDESPTEELVECKTHHFVGKENKCNQCGEMYYNFCLDAMECKVHHHNKKKADKQ